MPTVSYWIRDLHVSWWEWWRNFVVLMLVTSSSALHPSSMHVPLANRCSAYLNMYPQYSFATGVPQYPYFSTSVAQMSDLSSSPHCGSPYHLLFCQLLWIHWRSGTIVYIRLFILGLNPPIVPVGSGRVKNDDSDGERAPLAIYDELYSHIYLQISNSPVLLVVCFASWTHVSSLSCSISSHLF